MPDPLILFGSGGHAKVILEAVLARTPERQIVILDDAQGAAGRSVLGIKVHGGRAELDSFPRSPVVPAIGDNAARASLLSWLRERGSGIETVVHPAAVIGSSVEIGDGAFISAGAVVIAEARIGAAAVVNTSASIDHDCVIGEAAHIGPGAHLCGNVRVGARTLIGVGASVRPGISICEDAVIGAGSAVVSDIDEPGTFAGNPARGLG